jgi:hypothetical protein
MSASQPPAVGSSRVALLERVSVRTVRWAWGLFAVFTVVQLARVLQPVNTLSADEALAILAGQRTLEGHGIQDRYLTFLPGSLVWPILTSIAYGVGGIGGARLLALLCTLLGLISVTRATRQLFGDRAAVLTGVTMMVSAPYIVISRVAFMETLAFASLAVAFWAVTMLVERNHRLWIAVAAAAMALAFFAQYRAALTIIPLTLLLLAVRGRRGQLDAALLWLMASLAFIIYFQAFSTQLVNGFQEIRLFSASQSINLFASDGTRLLLLLFWGGIPLLIALIGFWRGRDQRRLLGALVIGPALWFLGLLVLSDPSHSLVFPDLAIGMVLIYPVVGYALAQARLSNVEYGALALLAILIGVIGYVHSTAFERSWPDSSRTSAFLATQVEPEERLLASDRWPLALSLYDTGQITGPEAVLDEAGLFGLDQIIDFCTFDWFVTEPGIAPWSASVELGIRACGSFETVQIVPTDVSGISNRLRATERTIWVTVERNTNPFSEASP